MEMKYGASSEYGFVSSVYACRSGPREQAKLVSRREILIATFVSVGIFGLRTSQSSTAQASRLQESRKANWPSEQLCTACNGRGQQRCSFCDGSGVFVVNDGYSAGYQTICPNCKGAGFIACPKCLTLGLADVRGVLRNGKNYLRIVSLFYFVLDKSQC